MITGEGPRRLAELIEKLRDVPQLLAPVTTAVSHEAVVRIKDCFNRSQTPYGDAWAPVARGGMPLLDTARLRNGFVDNSRPGTVEISNPTKYANVQNYGATIAAKTAKYLRFQYAKGKWASKTSVTIQARQFIPDDKRGIPDAWAAKFEKVVEAVLHAHVHDQ